jgi:TolB-like protein/predicted Zn-dependent protease
MKDRRHRYETAGEVRSALEAVRAHGAGSAVSGAQVFSVKRPFIAGKQAFTLSAALAIAVALGLWWLLTRPAGTAAGPASGRPAVAVMAFDNVAGTQDTAWLSKGVPTMLLTGLAQTRGLEIVSAQRLHEALKQLGHDSLESLDQAQAADVGRRAGATAVVVGSVAKSGSELRIDAQLEDLSTGRVMLAETVRGTDVFVLVDQLAARIREGVGFSDVTGIRPVVDVSSSSLEAYRLYSQALDAYVTVRWADAQKLFEEAIAIDPGFAEAYLQLAFVNRLVGSQASWRDNLRNAAAHSERLNERQRLLLEVEITRQRGEAPAAVRLLDELIAKFPDSDDAYNIAFQLYGPFGLEHDSGKLLRILSRAVAARPSSNLLRNTYGYALLEAGRYADAIREFEMYAQQAPREPNPYDSLGEAYLNSGSAEKALESYSRALNVDPRFSSARIGRAWALGMAGNHDQALAEDPPDTATKSFILSRAGRYADAVNVLTAGRLDTEVSKSFSNQGSFSLLLSLFAVERRQYAAAREELRRAQEGYAQMTAPDQRPYLVLIDSMAGMLDIAQKRPDAARSRLDALKRRYNPTLVTENWWEKALDGDIALADGRLQDAADAYAAGEPSERMWLNMLMTAVSLVSNNLPSRDGLARVARARGDLAGAIQEYRRLTSGKSRWNAMLEPRYILEMARLLEQTGDVKNAAVEYSRFLDLWKNADPDLPELAEARRAVARYRRPPAP